MFTHYLIVCCTELPRPPDEQVVRKDCKDRKQKHNTPCTFTTGESVELEQVMLHDISPIAATPAIPSTAQRRIAPTVSLIVSVYGWHCEWWRDVDCE